MNGNEVVGRNPEPCRSDKIEQLQNAMELLPRSISRNMSGYHGNETALMISFMRTSNRTEGLLVLAPNM